MMHTLLKMYEIYNKQTRKRVSNRKRGVPFCPVSHFFKTHVYVLR